MNRTDMKAVLLNFLQQIGKVNRVEVLREKFMQSGFIYTWHPHNKKWFLQYDYSDRLTGPAISAEIEGRSVTLKD